MKDKQPNLKIKKVTETQIVLAAFISKSGKITCLQCSSCHGCR